MKPTTFYLPTREAAEALGISHRTLKNLRLSGVLRPGRHYVSMGVGTRSPRLKWNIEAVEETLSTRTRQLGIGTGRAR